MRTKDYEQRIVEKDNEVIGVIADSAIRFRKSRIGDELTVMFCDGSVKVNKI